MRRQHSRVSIAIVGGLDIYMVGAAPESRHLRAN